MDTAGSCILLVKAGAPVSMIKLAGRRKGDTWSIHSRMTHTIMNGVATGMIGLKDSQPTCGSSKPDSSAVAQVPPYSSSAVHTIA